MFRSQFIVRTYEVDGFLHVNNAVYAQYLEAARGDFIRAIGLGYAKFHEWGAWPVLKRLTIDYAASAQADDELSIELDIAEWRRTQFTITYDVRRVADGALIARAETRLAFTDPDGQVLRVPTQFREAAQRYYDEISRQ